MLTTYVVEVVGFVGEFDYTLRRIIIIILPYML